MEIKKENIIFFISGHREISEDEFKVNYIPAIKKALNMFPYVKFVVGDYYGVDIMAQNYLADIGYADLVTVFHMFEKPRNINPAIKSTIGGFTTDIERDSAMTRVSDFDIAFVRKGKWESGTAQNIKRRMELKPYYNGDC